ncbi:hypothetical protein JXB02_05930 [Candidatus Woesearchaeota archaeon]|nr:hypothetical protein [Candidatus Woesearchaeota archaeon]
MALAALLLLAAAAQAKVEFSATVTPIKNDIRQTEAAQFLLEVSNSAQSEDDFDLRFTNDPKWSIQTSPVVYYTSEYGMTVPPDSSKKATITLAPLSQIPLGVHLIELFITSRDTGDEIKKLLGINVRSNETPLQEYLPSFTASMDVVSRTDPRKALLIVVRLKNQNSRDIEELHLDLSSSLIQKTATIPLGPYEEKIYKFVATFHPYEEPRQDTITLRVYTLAGNKTFETRVDPITYAISPYSTFVKDSRREESFLKSIETVSIQNDGNIRNQEDIMLPTSFFARLFTSSYPEATVVKEDGERFLSWQVPLDPQKSASIRVVVNYRPLFVIGLLLALGIVGYYLLRPKVIIRKNATHIATKEGGISELKVILLVRSRTKHPIDELKVLDKVPSIAEISEEHQLGTLRPAKVVYNEKKGTVVKYELATLEPYEERIITYKIKSKLSILGGMRLPRAIVKYTSKHGTMVLIHSNPLSLELE